MNFLKGLKCTIKVLHSPIHIQGGSDYLAGYHLIIRSVNLSDIALGAIWGSVFCSRTLWHVNCRVWDRTRYPLDNNCAFQCLFHSSTPPTLYNLQWSQFVVREFHVCCFSLIDLNLHLFSCPEMKILYIKIVFWVQSNWNDSYKMSKKLF